MIFIILESSLRILRLYQDYVLRVSHNSKLPDWCAGIGNPIVELAYSGLL